MRFLCGNLTAKNAIFELWQRPAVARLRYFSLLTRTKQLLLVTFCDTLAGIEISFWADGTGRTDERTNGWTDRRGSQNSYLDVEL